MRFLSCAVVSVMTVLWFASPALAVSVTIFEESIAGDADGSHPGVTTVGLTDGSNVIVGSLASPAVDDYFRVPVGGGTATITDMTLTVDGDGSSGVTSVYVLFFDSEGNFVGQTSPPVFGVPFSDQSLFSGTGFGPSTPGFSEWANNQTEFFFQISSAGQSGMANNNYSLTIESTLVLGPIFEESIAGDADGSHPGVTTVGLTDGSNVIVGSLASPAVDDYFRVPVGGGTATITDMTLTVDGDGSSGVTSVYVLFFDSEGNFVGQTSPPVFGVPFSDQSLFSGTGFGPSTPGFSEWANNQTEFFFQISSAGQSGMANNNYSLAIDSTVDSDGDGVGDSTDAFPVNPNESVDTDGDGTGDNGDPCPIDPNDDSDGDGSCDSADAFPLDPSETADTDGDGTGDNADAFPFDASEETDTDGDGIGNNADTDDDSDGISDAIEIAIGFDPIKSDSNDNGTADGDALVARLQNCADEVVPILTPPGSSVLIGLLLGFGAARLHARRGRRAH